MAVKSAMMTTSTPDQEPRRFGQPGPIHAQGAGNVRPDRMFNPGVIFDAGHEDWLGFLEGLGYDTGPSASPIDPSDYNSPSIAVGKLVGTKTVTRRVTAVSPASTSLT